LEMPAPAALNPVLVEPKPIESEPAPLPPMPNLQYAPQILREDIGDLFGGELITFANLEWFCPNSNEVGVALLGVDFKTVPIQRPQLAEEISDTHTKIAEFKKISGWSDQYNNTGRFIATYTLDDKIPLYLISQKIEQK